LVFIAASLDIIIIIVFCTAYIYTNSTIHWFIRYYTECLVLDLHSLRFILLCKSNQGIAFLYEKFCQLVSINLPNHFFSPMLWFCLLPIKVVTQWCLHLI